MFLVAFWCSCITHSSLLCICFARLSAIPANTAARLASLEFIASEFWTASSSVYFLGFYAGNSFLHFPDLFFKCYYLTRSVTSCTCGQYFFTKIYCSKYHCTKLSLLIITFFCELITSCWDIIFSIGNNYLCLTLFLTNFWSNHALIKFFSFITYII